MKSSTKSQTHPSHDIFGSVTSSLLELCFLSPRKRCPSCPPTSHRRHTCTCLVPVDTRVIACSHRGILAPFRAPRCGMNGLITAEHEPTSMIPPGCVYQSTHCRPPMSSPPPVENKSFSTPGCLNTTHSKVQVWVGCLWTVEEHFPACSPGTRLD